MSLYSKAQNDQAAFLFPLDSTISNSWGYGNLTTSYEAADSPTSTTDSKTGNAAYVFNGTSNRIFYTKTYRSSDPTSNSDIHVEAVIKTTTVASAGNFRVFVHTPDVYEVAINENGKIWARMNAGVTSRDVTGSTTVTDGKWHYIVARWEGDRLKIYVDGQLDGTSSALNSTPRTRDTYTRSLGGRADGALQKFAGTIDFFAEYQPFVTGINFDIADHFTEIANNSYAAAPQTSSALMVQPAVSGTASYTSGTLTASAASGDHYASTIDIQTLLNSYMSTLSLEQWYRFDEPKAITNYGSGGTTGWVFTGNSNCQITSGIQGSGALRTLATIDEQVYGLSTAPLSTEFTDNDFSVGLWTKRTEKEHAQVLTVSGSGDDSFTIYWNLDGYLNVNLRVNNTNHAIQQTVDKTDGNWHYVAARKSGNTLQMWVDNVSIGTTNVNQDMANLNRVTFGGSNFTNTEQVYISQYYVGTAANITSTQIANIWAYGQATVQASAGMEMPKFSRDNALNTYILNNSPEFYFKMDEGTGVPTNSGSVSCTLTQQGTNFTQNVTSPNYKAYNFTNRDTQFTGSWTAPTGTFTTNDNQTIVMYAKTGTVTAIHGLGGAAAGGGAWGNGIFFQQLVNGTIRLRLQNGSTSQDATTSVSFADGNYHMFVGVKNGNTLKLYVDGVERASNGSTSINLTDSGQFAIAGAPGSAPATLSRNLTIDEFAVFNTAFSAQDALEVFQKVANEMDWTASTTFVMPAIAAGFGPTIAAAPMTAASDMLHPQHFSVAMTAFGTFVHPNFDAQVLINDTVAADPLTASALFHMPQLQIGEFNSVDHMDADATFVHPTIRTPGRFVANPFIATNATLVMPGIVTVKGARVFAETVTARAFLPLPPAYIQLTDDEYYNRLYALHSQKTIEPIQSIGATSLPNQATTDVAKSFLKFFKDVTADITVGSTNYLYNEMPKYVYDAVGTVYTDENGNPIPPDTTRRAIFATRPQGSITPTPMVSKGYFDAWDRKAVNFTNIEFDFNTDNQFNSQRQYSVEFTFKTTKSNQIITYGRWASQLYYTRRIGTIGLFDGKLYSMSSYQNVNRADVFPHPKNIDALAKAGLNTGYMVSNKRLDDGEWHHVVIQYGYEDNRTQYWIDGELDRQLIGNIPSLVPGSNGDNGIRPFIIGFNSNDANLSSDFQTSVWSWTPNKFLSEQDITLNYERAYKYSPVFAEPMVASVSTEQNHKAAGNRGRALMLYWWPTDTAQTGIAGGTTKDKGSAGEFDVETFDPILSTLDYVTAAPQEYEGWDVFPVDVTGYFVSDLVKPEAYGGPENILFGDAGGHILTAGGFNRPKWKFNARRTFRNTLTDAPRYIDLVNDIDLSLFDAIFFKNFPDQSTEINQYANLETVDSYFNIRELKIYEDFIASLRAAVDTGLSLYVTNTELALDLGIIDRVEIVSDMDDAVSGYDSDPYSPTIVPSEAAGLPISDGTTANRWYDTYKNNRMRLVNTVEGLTNLPGALFTDTAFWQNDDQIRWAGPDRLFSRFVLKPNGLSVGDEWIDSGYRAYSSYKKNYEAVPFANIKAGIPVVAFANQVRRGLDLIDNPYRNHATSIAVRPGDSLNGKLCGGKIFVNFTERLSQDNREEVGVDLIQDYWINYAYDEGIITQADKDFYLAATYNIDRRLAAGTLTQSEYNKLAFWSSNGMYVLQQNSPIGDDSDTKGQGGITRPKSQRVRKINKNGGISFQSVAGGSVWFTADYSFAYPRVSIELPSFLTRGFWWLSNKENPEGTIIGATAMTASAVAGQATPVPDRIISKPVEPMIGNARITETYGYTPNSINNLSLPMQASAMINDKAFRINAEPMIATASIPQVVRALTSSIDEVILYIMHEDPILYLREEVIK